MPIEKKQLSIKEESNNSVWGDNFFNEGEANVLDETSSLPDSVALGLGSEQSLKELSKSDSSSFSSEE